MESVATVKIAVCGGSSRSNASISNSNGVKGKMKEDCIESVTDCRTGEIKCQKLHHIDVIGRSCHRDVCSSVATKRKMSTIGLNLSRVTVKTHEKVRISTAGTQTNILNIATQIRRSAT